MIFDEESAVDAQKILAPPKCMILQKKLTQKKSRKKTEEGWSHVRPKNHFKNTNHIVYPFAKARREKINELQAMNFDDGSAYTHFYFSKFSKNGNSLKKIGKNNDANFFVKKSHRQKCLGVEKWNVGNRLKRVLAKFGADRNYVRGVNGRSKFRKIVPTKFVSRRSEVN